MTHCPPLRHFFPIIAQHFEFVNPPNNIQNGFFTPVPPFFSKVRKLTVFSRNPHTPIILQSVRLRMERGRVIRAEKPAFRAMFPPFGQFGLPTPILRKQKKSYARRTRRMSGI